MVVVDKKNKSKNIESIYALSPMQQGMLFHTLYAPDSGVYFEQFSCTFYGNFNVSAFEQAWQKVLERHPIFRTFFVWENCKKPHQVVRKWVNLPWSNYDWRSLSSVEQQERLEAFLQREREQGFELDKAPLIRFTLIKLREDTHQFIYSFHHLLMDGWCLSIICKEVFTFYAAYNKNQHLSLERPRPYRDYISWLQQQDLAQAEAFWRQTLQGFTAPTSLVAKLVAGKNHHQKPSYEEQQRQLSAMLTSALQSFTRQHHLTLNTLVQAAWALLLAHYSGESDVLFGATVSGRPAALRGVESMVGLFINTLPVRVQVAFNVQLLSWLKQLQAQQVEREQYSYTPLIDIHGWSEIHRGTPLFESIVVFENYPVDTSLTQQIEGLDIDNIRVFEQTNYPLTLVVGLDRKLNLQLKYDTSKFDAATINRMLGHLETLLEGMVANQEQRLADLPMLTEPERHQLLQEWNDTQTDYPQQQCIHELFEAQVERTPDAVAVVFADKSLTYCELNRRANKIAHHLRGLGVSADTLVGLYLERCVEMVVGLLAILKAGGAYLPIDTAYPAERIALMLEDAQVPILLTQKHLLEQLPPHTAQVICLDTDSQALAQQSQENLPTFINPENLAYVIYTSGSTGKPKGVAVPHRAVNRLVFNTNYIQFQPDDRVAQVSNVAFDAATFEIWGALLHGGQLIGIDKDICLSAEEFAAYIQQQQITTLFLTTALFNQFATVVPAAFKNLRQLLFGGEAANVGCVKEILTQGSPQRLLHVYGPTESTTFSCWYLVEDVAKAATNLPIGKPISNTQIYILNRHLQPVPIGVAGEVYIGGAGVARGYLNRPDLTTLKFIPNPFSQQQGAKLYKTGDLARYLSDGNIEFLGRLDNQVKIRGFRIELGEIEAVLAQHPAVQEAVVTATEDIPGNQRLLAYVVLKQTDACANAQLQQFLKQKLPEYMLPSAIVHLEALPLTANGKVDRRALPAFETTRPDLAGELVAPRTPIQEIFVGIWSEILGLQQVGVDDNFFELGGHSLLATQLFSRLRNTFSVELPLRSLFEAPTVAGLAERIETACRTQLRLQAPPLLPVDRDQYQLSFAQARLWFLEQLEPGNFAYNIPAGVRLTGSLHVMALRQSLNEIVHRHEALCTSFTTVNGEPVQVIAQTFALTLPVVDLRELPQAKQQAEVERLATAEAQRPFDLAQGLLLRATLLQLNETEHVLLLTMHHIVSDGWSMGVFIRELAALYCAFSTGKPSPLPNLPIQYADFAHWQRQWLQGEVLEEQLSYWKRQLNNAPPVLELPTDRPRPPIQSYRGAIGSLVVSESLTQKLKLLSQCNGVTLFMLLLAAFQTLLYRYTEQSDICIGSLIANRNRTETEGLIGFFVNTLVLRTDLSGNPSFQELLGRVREVALGAYAHQDLPFEQLVEALKPERSLSHQPLFQVMFILQNSPMPTLELPGLTLNSLELDITTAKFDLTLAMEDSSEGLVGSLEYNTDLFEAQTISRMLGHFKTLLEGIVADPQQRLSNLALLTQQEHQQLLVEWNHTELIYPRDLCIHQLFEAQVEKTPDAVALVFEEQILTYRELNTKANQLAHYLQALGMEPEVLVGICVERSVEMVVGLLGILKAGGAYVPLDPAYPPERLTLMLEDARVSVVVTQQSLLPKLTKDYTNVVCLDSDWQSIVQESQENVHCQVTSEHLAYVIYTSGSTGKPKGVQIEHRAVVNFLHAMRLNPGLTQEDALLAVTTISFDIAGLEIYLPLIVGARIVLSSREVAMDAAQLIKVLSESGASIMQATPASWQLLLQAGWRGNPQLKILCGGEALNTELANQLLEMVDSVWNMYGPTETTIWSACYKVKASQSQLPIGRPIPNTQFYILDRHFQPVPIGVPGELYIGGEGLARGYRNYPDLSAEKFIPNTFKDFPGARLYKTGDLARYQSDGNVEFLGRIDHQVKIRGFRIELGEIETVLNQHPGVQESVVIVREDVPGNKRLVAYVVLNQTDTCAIAQLHQFLKQKLPDYMVPLAIVELEALPLMPNGKVNRRALPQSDIARPELEETFIAPRDFLELQLVHIWEDVLDVRPIGVNDNFFNLGGHSLLAVRLMAQIQSQFGQNLPLATLFQAPTIEQMATTLRQDAGFLHDSPLVKIQSRGSKRPFFCLPGAGGNAIYLHNLARYLGSERPFYSLQARGLDGKQVPHTKIEDIAADYIAALQTIQPEGPYFLAGHCFGGRVAFEMSLQLQKQGQEVALLAIFDALAPNPHKKPVKVERNDARLLTDIAMDIESFFGKELLVSYDALQKLQPEEQLNYLLKKLQVVNILPPSIDQQQLRGLLQVYKSNLQAAIDYMPQDVYPNRIFVFQAIEKYVENSEEFSDEPMMGWDKFSFQLVESYEVPGNHATMFAEPHVSVLAKQLRACLDRVQTDD
ncbi:amino acid adenylation domain-containing protein [Nostoc sp.]|uniref:amino acid adenylation domain-containing protein n=1 Tax=Nostoc sp. TaxID=1180 RepID=UPI002FFC5F2B